MERKLLVEALAADLPPGTIQLNARVRAIRREPGDGLTKVELEDGSVMSTKVCSPVQGTPKLPLIAIRSFTKFTSKPSHVNIFLVIL